MEILGIRVDNITYQQTLETAKKYIDGKGKHYIVTTNPEIVVAAQKDIEFKEIINRASLSVPDGIGVVLASSILGEKLKERVSGVDLLYGLAVLAAEFGYSIFLLGGQEDVAEKAAVELKVQNPSLKIQATDGFRINNDGLTIDQKEKERESGIIERINKFKPEILVVAFGAPKQEKWIARNIDKLDIKLAIGVGGALDYISGQKKRAPQIIQKANLEWLYRLIREPSRIKRQLALLYFAFLIFKQKFQKKNPS